MTEFICPLDIGFLASELNTKEDLERFLGYYGIGVVWMAKNKQPNPTPTKPPKRPPEVVWQIRKTPNHKFPKTGKK